MLEDVNEMLASQKLHIDVPDNVKEKLVDLGYDPAMALDLFAERFRKILKTASLNSI